MTKSNTLTTTYNGFELIAESIISEINLFAFDDESRSINQATGEENIFYNSDAVYMLGGVIDQLAYSLVGDKSQGGNSEGKLGYLNKAQATALSEEERNPDAYRGSMQQRAFEQAQASYDNAYMLYMAMTTVFNMTTGWTWGGTQNDTTHDMGRTWFANHKAEMSSYRTQGKSKPLTDEAKAKAQANRRKQMLANLAKR
tara:strand:+ start:28 stop:624 length:597 start_codon:yes stop_codon:yes gene_type:complete